MIQNKGQEREMSFPSLYSLSSLCAGGGEKFVVLRQQLVTKN